MSIAALAVGLAMDATAVAAACGMAAPVIRPRNVLVVSGLFGGFQALMPTVGWIISEAVGHWIEDWDHWIAFALLSGLGLKMLRDARGAEGDRRRPEDVFRLRTLLILALATSIDALAVGVTLPMLGAPPAITIASIGCITAALSAGGLLAGRRFGGHLGAKLDYFGAAVLIGLAVKVLVEHLTRT